MDAGSNRAPRKASLEAIAGELAGIAESLSAAARPPSQAELDAERVRAIIRARRHRDGLFPLRLFSDPAWDILLELFACRLEQRPISVSQVCSAAAAPATTALRWTVELESHGLVCRRADPADGRRYFVELTEKGGRQMQLALMMA